MKKNYLIIGASAAGIGCALRLRMLDAAASITVLNAEEGLPYNKCHMADVLLLEKTLDDITFCDEAMLAQKNIALVSNAKVVALEPENKIVRTEGGQNFSYEVLCIATGKSPRMLPIFEGKTFTNLFNFYYKSDLEKIIAYIDEHKPENAIVIGAGLTGLEAADSLRARGLKVAILEAGKHFLPTLITAHAANLIRLHLPEEAWLMTEQKFVGYSHKDNYVTRLDTLGKPEEEDENFCYCCVEPDPALDLSGHKEVETEEAENYAPKQLIVCAIGATPNTQFLPPEITLQDGYVVVDEYMQTSVPGIYAAGDCCMVYDQLTKRVQPNSLWPDAMQQGMYAAYGMTGTSKKYPGSVSIASSSFFGYKVAIAGPVTPAAHQRVEEYIPAWYPNCPPAISQATHESACWYHRFVYDQEKLVGFMLIGNTSKFSEYRRQLLSS